MSRASHFLQSDAGLLTINGSASCVCEPEFIDGNRFIQFIGTYFGDCVYSNQDLASWCFGMLSLLTFIVVFLPQVWLNFTRKAVTGLSFGLLGLWTVGDVASLLGTYLANQLPPQRILAWYFLAADAVIILQWLWYNNFLPLFNEESYIGGEGQSNNQGAARVETGASGVSNTSGLSGYSANTNNGGRSGTVTYVPAEATPHDERTPLLASERRSSAGDNQTSPLLAPRSHRGSDASASSSTRSGPKKRASLTGNVLGYNTPALSGFNLTVVTSLSIALCLAFTEPTSCSPLFQQFANHVATPAICNAQRPISDTARILGYVCSWVSGLFYVTSRIPQIIENRTTQSVEGLSIPMFFLTVFGNIAYGMGIILRMPTIDSAFWLGTFPYILGSLGTIAFDFVILYQASIYGVTPASAGNEKEGEGEDGPQ